MNTYQLELYQHTAYPWHKYKNIYFRGFFFYDNELYNDLLHFTFDTSKLLKMNGSFAFIIIEDDTLTLITDKIRSIPLYYYTSKDSVIITDFYTNKCEDSLTKKTENYLQLGYQLGTKTLIENLHSVMLGTLLTFDFNKKTISNVEYYNHKHNYKNRNCTHDELTNNLLKIEASMSARMVTILNGRTAVVPLSGGYDSRYVLCLLLKIGYKNIVAYTYGDSNNEIKVAKKVASQLNIHHIIIPFKKEILDTFFDEKYEHYSNYSMFVNAIPLEQEYFAMKYLTDNKLIPTASMMLPGYCADLQGGSYLLPTSCDTSKNIVEYIIDKMQLDVKKIDIKEIQFDGIIENNEQAVSEFENWFTKEKVSKLIINGVRAYEYHGFEWYLLFWDEEYISFYYNLDTSHRVQSSFYINHIFNQYFIPLHVNYSKKNYFINEKYAKIKSSISSILNYFRIELSQNIKDIARDTNGLEALRNMLQTKLKIDRIDCDDINRLEARYFIRLLKKKLQKNK